MNTVQIGQKAELKAKEYLHRQGFKIIAQNWKTPACEIDIVALKNKCIYFVEVKYRSNSRNGDGFDYITSHKLHRMHRAAKIWILANNWFGCYELSVMNVMTQTMKIDFMESIT